MVCMVSVKEQSAANGRSVGKYGSQRKANKGEGRGNGEEALSSIKQKQICCREAVLSISEGLGWERDSG